MGDSPQYGLILQSKFFSNLNYNYFQLNQLKGLNVIKNIFLQVLNEKQHEMAAKNEYNFDHPDAFDFELLKITLQRLKEGRKVEVPVYNFLTHSRENRTVNFYFNLKLIASPYNLRSDHCFVIF